MDKELEKAAFDYINSEAVKTENMQLAFGDFINGAEWMQKKMIDKACEWLKKCFYEQEHESDYGYYITFETIFDDLNDVIDDFRKAMEE